MFQYIYAQLWFHILYIYLDFQKESCDILYITENNQETYFKTSHENLRILVYIWAREMVASIRVK